MADINFVRERLARLSANLRTRSIIVFGSHSRGNSTLESDVDILIILDEGESQSKVYMIDGVSFDVTTIGLSCLESRLIRARGRPNNFFLDILANGIVLDLADVRVAEIIGHANVAYAAGPPSLTNVSARDAVTRLEASLDACKIDRALSVADMDEQHIRLSNINTAVRLSVSMHLHFHNRWVSSFRENVRSISAFNLPLRSRWDEYCVALGKYDLVANAARLLVEYVLNDFNSLLHDSVLISDDALEFRKG